MCFQRPESFVGALHSFFILTQLSYLNLTIIGKENQRLCSQLFDDFVQNNSIWPRFYYLKQMSYLNREGRQEFKAKVGHLMEEYERNKQEELMQKQQLKQNIMIQILNKRTKQSPQTVKEQTKSHTNKTANSDPQSQECLENQDLPQITFSPADLKATLINVSSVPRARADEVSKDEEAEPLRPQEITFKMKKRNKSLDEQLQDRFEQQVKEKAIPEPLEEEELNKSINRIAKYANKYFPDHFKDNLQPSKLDAHKEIDYFPGQLEEPQNYSRSKQSSYLKNYLANKKHENPNQMQPEEDNEEGKEPYVQVEESLVQQNQGGVFLTMEESESMTASELPKNVSYQIKMDKSVDPEQLEELKKQKIKQMEKKRQERIEQFRRSEALKKVQIPRGRSSHAFKHERTQKQEPPSPKIPPKSTMIQRKSNIQKPPKMENRSEREPPIKNQCIPLESHEEQQQMKQSRANKNQNPKYENKQQYIQVEDCRPVSPIRTPKTVISEHRPKSTQKNSNIFVAESQYTREKSANRMTEPKIEPKDRKYSFTRQSNKKLMINAITYVCFPGELNRKDRERLTDVLQSSEHQFFVFLFKEYSRKIIKGIYILDNTQTRLEKIYGDKAPFEITADRVQEFYRFDSGSREFKKVTGCRSFSFVIHAIDLM